jgi:hypothetical protein
MPAVPLRIRRTLLAAIVLGSGVTAFAGQELMMLEAPQRAKVAKEKIRAGALQRKVEEQEKKASSFGGQGAADDGCGSQSIGNIDTEGRGGPAPREVFVFAPNAINIVGRGACR